MAGKNDAVAAYRYGPTELRLQRGKEKRVTQFNPVQRAANLAQEGVTGSNKVQRAQSKTGSQ